MLLKTLEIISKEYVNILVPWAYFDGASHETSICGGGLVLYLNEYHFFIYQIGLGRGTNNYAYILSLKFLLCFSIKKDCQNLQTYGDLMNVKNWLMKHKDVNHTLLPILEEILH